MCEKALHLVLTAILLLSFTGCMTKSNQSNEADTISSMSVSDENNSSERDLKSELYTAPAMTEEQQEYYDEYLSPILFTSLLTKDWSAENYDVLAADISSGRRPAALIMAFEDITGSDEMRKLRQEYDSNFPADIVEDVLLARFPFTADQLHEILPDHYNVDKNIYYYEGGRGGGPIEGAVTDVRTEGDLVNLDYVLLTGFSGLDEDPGFYIYKTPGTLVLKPNAVGGYLYWSVDVGEQIEAPGASSIS